MDALNKSMRAGGMRPFDLEEVASCLWNLRVDITGSDVRIPIGHGQGSYLNSFVRLFDSVLEIHFVLPDLTLVRKTERWRGRGRLYGGSHQIVDHR